VDQTEGSAKRQDRDYIHCQLTPEHHCYFVTTTPPVGGSLVVGCALTFGMSQCTVQRYVETLMSSRSRVCCTLFLIAYPFFCTGVSTAVIAFGFLVACWKSQSSLVRHGSTFVVLIPILLIPLFLWTQVVLNFYKAQEWTARHVGRAHAGDYRRGTSESPALSIPELRHVMVERLSEPVLSQASGRATDTDTV